MEVRNQLHTLATLPTEMECGWIPEQGWMFRTRIKTSCSLPCISSLVDQSLAQSLYYRCFQTHSTINCNTHTVKMKKRISLKLLMAKVNSHHLYLL